MRLTRILLWQVRRPGAAGRAQQDPRKVPFKPIIPLALSPRVSGKVDSQSQVACLHEMSILFAAMKEKDFNEKLCTKEIDALKKSNIDAMNKAREDKMKNSGQVSSVGQQLTSKQLNRYFRKFPM